MTIQVCVCHGVDGGVGFAAKCASQSADATSTLMQLKVRNARNASVSEIREGRKLATRGSPVLLRRTSTNLGKHLPGLAWRTSSKPRAHTYGTDIPITLGARRDALLLEARGAPELALRPAGCGLALASAGRLMSSKSTSRAMLAPGSGANPAKIPPSMEMRSVIK